jgi:hypothetical protein
MAFSAATLSRQDTPPEVKVLTEHFGPAKPYNLESVDRRCPRQQHSLGQPQASHVRGRFTAKQWKVDDARQIVVFERDGRAQVLWFLADAKSPDEVQGTVAPGASEVGWLDTDIRALLHDIAWDRVIGERLGCSRSAMVFTTRLHREQYFARGMADATETNLDNSIDGTDCTSPSYHRFMVSPVEVRSGIITRLIPRTHPAQTQINPEKGLEISDALANIHAEIAAAPRIRVDDLDILVSDLEYSQMHVDDQVQYGVDVCGSVAGIWPPSDLSRASH